MSADPVDALLAAHGLSAPWQPLHSTGLANRIYGTSTVVLRVATDHPEAVPDARTESVAAPIAHAAGIRTPRLLAFDDSRTIVDRPFSIWERVHGETLGVASLAPKQREDMWRETGRELARLHTEVRSCPDPCGYLDSPGFELNLEPTLKRLVDTRGVSAAVRSDIERLIGELSPYVTGAPSARCFVHDDVHEMNVMCTREGGLLALIDWGDAGWGDPARDFSSMPLEMIPAALDGYGPDCRGKLGTFPEARFVWAKLHDAMDDVIDGTSSDIPLSDWRRFLEAAGRV